MRPLLTVAPRHSRESIFPRLLADHGRSQTAGSFFDSGL